MIDSKAYMPDNPKHLKPAQQRLTTGERRRQKLAQNPRYDVRGQIIVSLFRLLSFLPLRWIRGLGQQIGRLICRLDIQDAKVARENIGYAFAAMPTDQQHRLAKQSIIESAKTALEMAAVWFRNDQWLERVIVEQVNRAQFDQAMAADKGLILLSPHIGNWEVLGRYLGLIAPGITVMYKPAQSAAMDALIRKARLRNMNVAPTDRSGVMMLLKALKTNGVVGILPDQVPTEGGGEFADFYGKPALTMTMIRQLQKKTNAAVLMVHSERVESGFRVVFTEPHESIYAQEPEQALLGLNRSVEKCIDQIPAQYQWQYKRYRRQPKGVARPYRY